MISIKIDGMENLMARLDGMKRQIPFATVNAINNMAFDIRKVEMDAIDRIFPTAKPQTKKNVFVNKARTSNLQATVFFDQIYAKGINEYMGANIHGGGRMMKPSEQRLGRYYVPGIGAKMDQYGNMQGGQVTQILSRLGRFGDVAGYDMNQTANSRKRRSGGSKSTEYFMISRPTGGLQPGIYLRTQKQGGFTSTGAPRATRGKTGAYQKSSSGPIQARGAIPVVLFMKKAPTYKAVWPFFVAGQQAVDSRFKGYVQAAIDAEIQKEMAYRARH